MLNYTVYVQIDRQTDGYLNISTCAAKGHHSYWHKVDDISLPGGEFCQPHIKHTDKDQRPES